MDRKVASICDELRMAIRWNRPSILLGIGGPRARRAAQTALRAWLREQGQRVETVRVSSGSADIPLLLSRKRLRERTVYFVERLGAGGDSALRALNMRREYLVDYQVRVVFWLNSQEERRVAERAPDFWAFRHRVVDFGQDGD